MYVIVCDVGNSGNGKRNAKVVIIAMLYVNLLQFTVVPAFAVYPQRNDMNTNYFFYSLF